MTLNFKSTTAKKTFFKEFAVVRFCEKTELLCEYDVIIVVLYRLICSNNSLIVFWFSRDRKQVLNQGVEPNPNQGVEPNSKPESQTEPEPELYKPSLRYFCQTLTEPELYFSNSQRANRN